MGRTTLSRDVRHEVHRLQRGHWIFRRTFKGIGVSVGGIHVGLLSFGRQETYENRSQKVVTDITEILLDRHVVGEVISRIGKGLYDVCLTEPSAEIRIRGLLSACAGDWSVSFTRPLRREIRVGVGWTPNTAVMFALQQLREEELATLFPVGSVRRVASIVRLTDRFLARRGSQHQ